MISFLVFFCEKIKFLGHLITPEGILTNPEKIEAISKMVPPRNVRHLKTFLQTCSWYRKFVQEFGDIARPLNDLTKKNSKWEWSHLHQNAFDSLKHALVNAPILQQVDPNKPFILRTDASNYALGAVLLQKYDSDESR